MELIDFELETISSTEPLDEIVQQRCLVYCHTFELPCTPFECPLNILVSDVILDDPGPEPVKNSLDSVKYIEHYDLKQPAFK